MKLIEMTVDAGVVCMTFNMPFMQDADMNLRTRHSETGDDVVSFVFGGAAAARLMDQLHDEVNTAYVLYKSSLEHPHALHDQTPPL